MQQILIKGIAVIITLILVMSCLPVGKYPGEISVAAKEFRSFKGQKGHFSGGQYNEHLDKWDGKKHQVMQKLASFLNETPVSKDELISLMGNPDEWKNNIAVYFWRGQRDYLVIKCTTYCNNADWIYNYE